MAINTVARERVVTREESPASKSIELAPLCVVSIGAFSDGNQVIEERERGENIYLSLTQTRNKPLVVLA